jgi:hypothetical protein
MFWGRAPEQVGLAELGPAGWETRLRTEEAACGRWTGRGRGDEGFAWRWARGGC